MLQIGIKISSLMNIKRIRDKKRVLIHLKILFIFRISISNLEHVLVELI